MSFDLIPLVDVDWGQPKPMKTPDPKPDPRAVLKIYATQEEWYAILYENTEALAKGIEMMQWESFNLEDTKWFSKQGLSLVRSIAGHGNMDYDFDKDGNKHSKYLRVLFGPGCDAKCFDSMRSLCDYLGVKWSYYQ